MTAPHLASPHLPHGLVMWRQAGIVVYAEPWYAAYVLLAIVQGGMLPVLLPLSADNPAHAGLIVGAMNLAGLSAPWIGHLADGRGWHRPILLAGLFAVAAALVALPWAGSLALHLGVALALGLGFAAANTVANMFIVETRPPAEWDRRIGALQACAGIGQVVGLLAAGLFGKPYTVAFVVAAGLVAAALPIAWRTLRHAILVGTTATPRAMVAAQPPVGGEGWAGSPARHFHRPTLAGMRRLLAEVETPFVRLLLSWFVAFTATTAVLTMFPLALWHAFAAPVRVASSTYAVAAALSLPLYVLAARLAGRVGGRAVMRLGFATRAVALLLLCTATLAAPGALGLALAAFVLLVLAWPALAVSGTALAATLAPGEKGEAIGLFNATSSLAGACGALLGGWAFGAFGYAGVCGAASVALVVAVLGVGAGRRSAAMVRAG